MKEIYNAQGTLNCKCESSHISYVFYIDKDYELMQIYFTYDDGVDDSEKNNKELIVDLIQKYCEKNYPKSKIVELKEDWKKFSPVKNLFTLSVKDENGFRGAGHRTKYNETVSIGNKNTSNGYISGLIPQGNFEITISIHAILKISNYNLRVLVGGSENE